MVKGADKRQLTEATDQEAKRYGTRTMVEHTIARTAPTPERHTYPPPNLPPPRIPCWPFRIHLHALLLLRERRRGRLCQGLTMRPEGGWGNWPRVGRRHSRVHDAGKRLEVLAGVGKVRGLSRMRKLDSLGRVASLKRVHQPRPSRTPTDTSGVWVRRRERVVVCRRRR